MKPLIEHDAKMILPSNSTPLERAADLLNAMRFDALMTAATDIGDLWDPWRCRRELLPWLAHAMSVDVWSNAWDEQVQRQAIADAIFVHKLKGTPASIAAALSNLEASIGYQEWREVNQNIQANGFNALPITGLSSDLLPSSSLPPASLPAPSLPPHSGVLTAVAADNVDSDGNSLFTPEFQQQLWRVVDLTKAVRTHLHLQVSVAHQSHAYAASSHQSVLLNAYTANAALTPHQFEHIPSYIAADLASLQKSQHRFAPINHDVYADAISFISTDLISLHKSEHRFAPINHDVYTDATSFISATTVSIQQHDDSACMKHNADFQQQSMLSTTRSHLVIHRH